MPIAKAIESRNIVIDNHSAPVQCRPSVRTGVLLWDGLGLVGVDGATANKFVYCRLLEANTSSDSDAGDSLGFNKVVQRAHALVDLLRCFSAVD